MKQTIITFLLLASLITFGQNNKVVNTGTPSINLYPDSIRVTPSKIQLDVLGDVERKIIILSQAKSIIAQPEILNGDELRLKNQYEDLLQVILGVKKDSIATVEFKNGKFLGTKKHK